MMRTMLSLLLRFTLLFWMISAVAAQPTVMLPRTAITADELAVIVNEDDPLSRETAAYYLKARHVPEANLIRVHLPAGRPAISREDFAVLKREIDRQTRGHIQAYAIAWTAPYRAGCMSLTSAIAFGYDEKYCSTACRPTAASPYFNSPSVYPAIDLHLRPAMMLAGRDIAAVKALIDRGVAADASFPDGRAYLLETADRQRSVRAAYFDRTRQELAGVFPIEVLATDALVDRRDVLFYFTGLARVPKLDTLRFLPGALADHLTSFGGQLLDSSQMSSLDWLAAGATASYGTVVEPCNHPQKFPLPAVAMLFYASGATAIEAYWKSVAWPGEGVFIGEPLARPFAPSFTRIEAGIHELRLYSPREGGVRLEFSESAMGPYRILGPTRPLQRGANRLRFAIPLADGYVRVTLSMR